MARSASDINPDDVFPPRDLPGTSEVWGRIVEDRLVALEKAALGQQGSIQGTNRNIAASTASLADQVSRVFATTPVGMVVPYSSAVAPFGWLICDGSEVLRDTYPDLYGVIGITYGSGDGTTTFNLPNLTGRVPVGYDASQAEFNTIGETGGAKTHTLTTGEMPSHTHTFTGTAHRHSVVGLEYTANTIGLTSAYTTAVGGGTNNTDYATAGGTNSSEGGSGAHNNLQPYIALPYIIKHSSY